MISIHFYIDDQKHEAPKSWSDVTFDKFLRYFDKVAAHEPEVLKKFIEKHYEAISGLEEGLNQEEKEAQAQALFMERWNALSWKEQKECYDFFALDVSYWCNVSAKDLQTSLDKDVLFAAFWALQVQMNPDNAKVNEDYTGFAIDGVEYLLPAKHMEGSTVEEFSSAAQFQENMNHLKGGHWRSMLDVMTVLCRPKGELYNYDKMFVATRKNLFRRLPMTDVINVAFFLLRLNDTLKNTLLIYTAQQELERTNKKSLAIATDGLP
ncbi:hypothetical protein AB832_06920 [Flavobacteriaceae bacterium (ex Bugula neritina AB1)]|nr:hypothetical protein AB832_06920 [Flavobacteriaceae bacterium (ex Bugula neritina AB1)]